MNIFVLKLSKIAAQKKFFSSFFSVFFGFRSFLTVFVPPLPEVGCPIFLEIRNPWGKVIERSPVFLEIRNPWGKVMERSGLRYENFCLKLSKIAAQKKFLFSLIFSLLR